MSTKLTERYNITPISTGDLLRSEVRAGTELGKEAESIMASGRMVDDRLVLKLVRNKLEELKAGGVHVSSLVAEWSEDVGVEA